MVPQPQGDGHPGELSAEALGRIYTAVRDEADRYALWSQLSEADRYTLFSAALDEMDGQREIRAQMLNALKLVEEDSYVRFGRVVLPLPVLTAVLTAITKAEAS